MDGKWYGVSARVAVSGVLRFVCLINRLTAGYVNCGVPILRRFASRRRHRKKPRRGLAAASGALDVRGVGAYFWPTISRVRLASTPGCRCTATV